VKEHRVQSFDGVVMLAVGDTMLSVWKSGAELHRWRWFRSQMERFAERHENGIQILMLVLSSSAPPGSEVRKEVAESLRRLTSRLRRVTTVAVGESFWLTVVRSIMRTMLLLSGNATRQKVVATIDEGIDSVLSLATPETPSREELRAAIEAMYRELQVEPIASAS
jgi:hypothetical protein